MTEWTKTKKGWMTPEGDCAIGVNEYVRYGKKNGRRALELLIEVLIGVQKERAIEALDKIDTKIGKGRYI